MIDQLLSPQGSIHGHGCIAFYTFYGGEWDRGDVERWALLRNVPPSLRTTLELPTPQLSMDELLQKAHTLYVTLPSATVFAIAEIPTELAAAVTAGDIPAVNALFKIREGHGGNGEKKKKQQQCWYHGKFGDESRCCSIPTTLPTISARLAQRSHNRVGKR